MKWIKITTVEKRQFGWEIEGGTHFPSNDGEDIILGQTWGAGSMTPAGQSSGLLFDGLPVSLPQPPGCGFYLSLRLETETEIIQAYLIQAAHVVKIRFPGGIPAGIAIKETYRFGPDQSQ